MPLRFRPAATSRSAGGAEDAGLPDAPVPAEATTPGMVADNPPPLRQASYLSQPVQSLIVPLPAEGDRWQHAFAQMRAVLDDWALSPALARRWLAAARPALEDEDVVELYIELDPISHLITIEIWNDHGERVFGVDDYLPGADGVVAAYR